jgi:hypothetical protein
VNTSSELARTIVFSGITLTRGGDVSALTANAIF